MGKPFHLFRKLALSIRAELTLEGKKGKIASPHPLSLSWIRSFNYLFIFVLELYLREGKKKKSQTLPAVITAGLTGILPRI